MVKISQTAKFSIRQLVDVFLDCCLTMMQITRELPITDITKLNNMAVAKIIVVGKLNWRSMVLGRSVEK